MRLSRHLVEQPFIFATGLAALVHSTWSLGTLFAGPEPAQFTLPWFAWLIPALLIAFSLDIGQIMTSAEIRAGYRSLAKYLTFIVLAAATYYLQWLYISHHMPQLALSPGVRESWGEFATLLRDAAIWVVPALLPLSTTLYTFSHTRRPAQDGRTVNDQATPVAAPSTALTVIEPETAVTLPDPDSTSRVPVTSTHWPAQCPHCGWSKDYLTQQGAENALRAHSRHCPRWPRGEQTQLEPISVLVNER